MAVKARVRVARALPSPEGFAFVCNICGSATAAPVETVSNREAVSCHVCRSNLRFRGLMAALSYRVHGEPGVLAMAPRRPDVVGLGLSDSPVYSQWLREKFAYTNTFLHRRPVVDILQPDPRWFGRNDFVISSDVFEHVRPPVGKAISNARKLLKPDGSLIVTVPYKFHGATDEHYPNLHDYEIVRSGGGVKLVNTTRDHRREVFDSPVFLGGHGLTLEMRVFSLPGLVAELEAAGFKDIRVHDEPIPEWGILCRGQPSLPVSARA